MKTKTIALGLSAVLAMGGVATPAIAFAQTDNPTAQQQGEQVDSVNPNTGIGAKDATGDYTFVSTFGLTDKDAKERLLKVTSVNLFKPCSETRIRAKVRISPDGAAIKYGSEFTEKLKADDNGCVPMVVRGVEQKVGAGEYMSHVQLLDYEGWIKTSLLPTNNKTSFTVHVDALKKLNGKYDITYRFPNLDKNIENNPILLCAATPISDWAPYVSLDPIEVANLTKLTDQEKKQVIDAFDEANKDLDVYTAAKKDGKTPVSFDKDFKNAIITWADGSTTEIPSWQFLKQKAGTPVPAPGPVPTTPTNSKEDKLNIEIIDDNTSSAYHVFKAVSYNGDVDLPTSDKISCDLPAKLNLINSTTGELLYSCDFKLKDGVFPAAITLKDVNINDDIMRTQNYDIKFSFDSYENNNKLMIGKIATQEFNNRYNVNFKATYTVERPKTETTSTQTDDFDISEHLKQSLDANATVVTMNNYKNADDTLKQAYDAAIIAGQKVYGKLSSTPEEVKQATESIKAALDKLNGDVKANTTISQLQSQLDAANGKIQTLSGELEKAKQQGITDASTIQSLTEQLQQTKDALEKLKSDKTLSEQQKQAEIDKLNGQIDELHEQTETAKDDSKEEKPVKMQGEKQHKGKLPQTSDAASIGAVGVLAGMLCVLVAIFKRRKL